MPVRGLKVSSPTSARCPLLTYDSLVVMHIVGWVAGCRGTGVVGDQLKERAHRVQGVIYDAFRWDGFHKTDFLDISNIRNESITSPYLGHVGQHKILVFIHRGNHLGMRLTSNPLLGDSSKPTVHQHLTAFRVVA